jgi:hypothetical protein
MTSTTVSLPFSAPQPADPTIDLKNPVHSAYFDARLDYKAEMRDAARFEQLRNPGRAATHRRKAEKHLANAIGWASR